MAVTNYHAVNGAILGETTSGVRIDFLPDAIGSVTAVADQTATVVGTARYRPYGAALDNSGTQSSRFGWIGRYGYAATQRAHADISAGPRHYGVSEARWTSYDPLATQARVAMGGRITFDLRFLLFGYRYASASPVVLVDPTGLAERSPEPEPPEHPIGGCKQFVLNEPVEPWLTVGITLGACVHCYDTSCCPAGDWASHCETVIIGIGAEVGLPFGNIAELYELEEELGEAWEKISQLVALLSNLALGCLVKEKACIAKGTESQLLVCFEACVIGGIFEMCIGYSWPGGVTKSIGFQTGYCGLPSLGVNGTYRLQSCE